ncbi:MAG: TlpA family protein disulfide reductase [Methylobacillus sp.]|jgi:peroxiredoxin|nr:TlpA family protein disulfide reductase [Methylobacillus sp.]
MSASGLRKLLIPLILLALVGALVFFVGNKNSAPDVKFTTLAGQEIHMQDLRGKIVLVNFWATTCPGCIEEMPQLIETYKQYRERGFEVIAVAMAYDPPNQVANYTRKNNLPFPVALDVQGDIAKSFNDVQLTPTAFVVDKEGRVVRNVVGVLDFKALHAMLDEQLGKKS